MIVVYILGGIILFLLLLFGLLYNKLVKLRNAVRSSWSDIDVQLKKRFNLVPNLVETVKGYASHEKSLFEEVTKARSKAMESNTTQESAASNNQLTGMLSKLFAVVENYPDLKANTNFLQLQQQLQEVEDTIERSRRYYNAVVRDYNTAVESVPTNIIASMFNFRQEEFFQLDDPRSERQAPKADFSS
jgi:LemA protein